VEFVAATHQDVKKTGCKDEINDEKSKAELHWREGDRTF
jgi:hypothetical protein